MGKRVVSVLGIRTWDRRIEGTNESTEPPRFFAHATGMVNLKKLISRKIQKYKERRHRGRAPKTVHSPLVTEGHS